MIDMRMAGYHLPGEGIAYVGYVKLRLLFGYLRIKTNVQQHVSQLLADIMQIIFDQRIAEFVCFLYRIGTQAFVGLLSIPRAIRP